MIDSYIIMSLSNLIKKSRTFVILTSQNDLIISPSFLFFNVFSFTFNYQLRKTLGIFPIFFIFIIFFFVI